MSEYVKRYESKDPGLPDRAAQENFLRGHLPQIRIDGWPSTAVEGAYLKLVDIVDAEEKKRAAKADSQKHVAARTDTTPRTDATPQPPKPASMPTERTLDSLSEVERAQIEMIAHGEGASIEAVFQRESRRQQMAALQTQSYMARSDSENKNDAARYDAAAAQREMIERTADSPAELRLKERRERELDRVRLAARLDQNKDTDAAAAQREMIERDANAWKSSTN